MSLIPPIFCSAAMCVALAGNAFAQSHNHGDQKHHDGTKPHSAMEEKMGHGNAAPGHGEHQMGNDEIPASLDTATSKMSDAGHYKVSISPEHPPVAINALHNWILKIATPAGNPEENATISIDGGMPAHGHGLPTAPRVTKYLGDGKYLIEGVRFNMGGWWQITFDISGTHSDKVGFNIVAQ